MLNKEIARYKRLNELAEQNGIVIMGGSEDKDIPMCELKQAFALDSKLYNRSFEALNVDVAGKLYDECVAPLKPESVLLHIGTADLEAFAEDKTAFANSYRMLIRHIRECDKKCRIAIISLKNDDGNEMIDEMNKNLKIIAESEQCEFGDIATKRVWNPKETKDVVSFVYSIGFVRPLTNKRPLYDLIKILFCSTQVAV